MNRYFHRVSRDDNNVLYQNVIIAKQVSFFRCCDVEVTIATGKQAENSLYFGFSCSVTYIVP